MCLRSARSDCSAASSRSTWRIVGLCRLSIEDKIPDHSAFSRAREEGVYLADVLVILSASAAVVKKVIEVDLPRPRHLKMLTTRRFGEIHKEVLHDLWQCELETDYRSQRFEK